MTDPILERFALACGARQPLVLRVDLAEGEKLAEGQIEMPFVLVGRDDACDVTLTDPEVDPRHLWLQVLDGQVYAVDLGSRTGLRWPDGSQGSGWLEVDRPLRVGPFVLRLQQPLAGGMQRSFSLHYQPLQSDPTLASRFSPTILEFRNGKRARDRWQVNRRLTLIGRAPECKIRLSADDITSYHCGLVLTSDGLWVVDLSGRGVVVNGERMRVAPLDDQADLWVGRFRIGVHVGASASSRPASGGDSPISSTATEPKRPRPTPSVEAVTDPQPGTPAEPPSALFAEDEVPLGVLAPHSTKEATGLSSSHIMAEAFLPSAESEISQSILIAQSGSLTPPPLARPASSQASPAESLAAAASTPTGDTLRENRLVTLLREMSELHHRMATLLQQSCEALLHLTIQLHPERQEEWQVSLNALRQISSILEGLQADLSRLSSETPREIRRPPPRSRPASSSSPSSEFAASGDPPDDPPPPTLEDAVLSTRLHVRVEPHHQARHPRNAP